MERAFGPFELTRALGRGGMGEVFLATRRDDAAKTRVVLKRLRPEIYENEEYQRRIIFEAQVGAKLEHPNLVKQIELGRVGDCPYLVLEYVHGFSLRRLLDPIFENEITPPPITVGAIVVENLLSGLTAMHSVKDDSGVSRPIIHRDVTPNNVIITSEGRPVLIDFGIAKDVMGPSITQYGKVIGTARYMSPEHREGESLDIRTDVFAVSMIAFELFFGRRPWPKLSSHKEMLRTVFDSPTLSPDEEARVPSELWAVLVKGLACEPNERWSSAASMLKALRKTEYFQMLLEGSQTDKWLKVSDWVESTGLQSDEELENMVVDHAPASGSDLGEHMRWTPAGRLERDPTPQPYRISELPPAQLLPIPPLPPRRELNLSTQELKMSEFAVKDRRWWVLGLIVLAIAGGVLGFSWGFISGGA